MEVKELANKIKELNIASCTSCPFCEEERWFGRDCKLHGTICICIDVNIGSAESLLQLEHFFETGEVKEILEEEEND